MQLKIICLSQLLPKLNYFGAFGHFLEAIDLNLTSISGLRIPAQHGSINADYFFFYIYNIQNIIVFFHFYLCYWSYISTQIHLKVKDYDNMY